MPSPELAATFEAHRGHVRAVAYRMLGSLVDADDAVQETWLRLSRVDAERIDNLRGWLTTVVGRLCLDMLRARQARRESSLDTHVPDPIVERLADRGDVEAEAVAADHLGLAMLVVLDTLDPAERVAFVLHDVFGLPFQDVAGIVERTPAAARQLASRARRRVRGRSVTADRDLREQRRLVEAFLDAVQHGRFETLLTLLDPDIELRADGGPAKGLSRLVRGASEVAGQAQAFSKLGLTSRLVLVNGDVGVASRLPTGRLLSVMGFGFGGGRIREMLILADPDRLARLESDVP